MGARIDEVDYRLSEMMADSETQMLLAARKLFRFSLIYLSAIFAVLLFEALTMKLLSGFGIL